MLLLQQILNGLVIGAGYALVGVGITLVLRVLDIVNFAHGELFMLGGLGMYIGSTQLGLSTGPAMVLSVAAVALIAAFELQIIERIRRTDPFNVILVTFAISAVLMNVANLYLEGGARTVAPVSTHVFRFGGLVISAQRLLVLATAVVLFALLILALERSKAGRQLRAVAQSQLGAEVAGIPVRKVMSRLFIGAGAVAGLAGAVLAPVIQVSPSSGLAIMLKGFVVLILGGLGSVAGAAVGGVALGVIEAVGATYLGSEWINAFGFVLLLSVLLVRPQGLFGARA